jgi:hypothetical protein
MRNTMNLYWFRPPESKILRPVVGVVLLVRLRVKVHGGAPLLALYLLTNKVGGPKVQVGYD